MREPRELHQRDFCRESSRFGETSQSLVSIKTERAASSRTTREVNSLSNGCKPNTGLVGTHSHNGGEANHILVAKPFMDWWKLFHIAVGKPITD